MNIRRDNNGEEGITITTKSLRDVLNRHIEPLFLFTICAITTILIFTLMDLNSIGSDETNYIHLGKSILNGEYPYPFLHRSPLIPSLISLFFSAGFSIHTIRLLIPVIFMNSALITTYFFAKILYTKKEALIATLFLFTFPFFWQWGLNVLTDIPLITLSTLFILFFYLGVEKDKKYLPISAIILVLAFLTKASAILLIAPAFLYLLITNKRLVLTKEFIISVVIAPLLFLFVYILFHIFLSVNLDASVPSRILSAPIRYLDMLSLGYAPMLLFGFFGISTSMKKRTIFLGLIVLIFITFFGLTNFRVRYLSPLFPIFGIFVARGYINLRDRFNRKKLVDLVLIIFLIISVANSLYWVDLSEKGSWGVVTLSEHVNTIEGNVTIASDYMPAYLKVSTSKNVIGIPIYYEVNDEILAFENFWSIVTNKSDPNSSKYAGLRKSGQIKPYFYYFDDEWIKDNHVDYVILSIYDEGRSSEMIYKHPKYALIEIPFIKISTYNITSFQSKLYKICEENYERVDEVYKGDQLIFIIYKV